MKLQTILNKLQVKCIVCGEYFFNGNKRRKVCWNCINGDGSEKIKPRRNRYY